MIKTIKRYWLYKLTIVLVVILLLCAFSQVAYGQATWGPNASVSSCVHLKDMNVTNRDDCLNVMGFMQDILIDINATFKYENGVKECNHFSEYTAKKLSVRGYPVKRAKSTTFLLPNGSTGEHHWVFASLNCGNTILWVPIECTPPVNAYQGENWPKVAGNESYHVGGQPLPLWKFDERYCGTIQIQDVPLVAKMVLPGNCTELFMYTADLGIGSANFRCVTCGGAVALFTSEADPVGTIPEGFSVVGSFADIQTTANYSCPILVGLNYDESEGLVENDLRLFHWDGSQWADVTTWVDTDSNIVYGEVESLSWFFIGGRWVWIEDSLPVFPSLYIGIAAALGAGFMAYLYRRRALGRRTIET